MTDQEINRKIAELCGWKREKRKRWGGTDNVDGWGRNQHLSLGHKDRQFTTWLEGHIPNYCSDLNAMHEVEKILEQGEDKSFEKFAHLVCCSEIIMEGNKTTLFDEYGWYGLLKATARQRAEAFLRVNGNGGNDL